MKEFGIFKWKIKGTNRVDTIPDAKLKRMQPKADHEYFSACVKLRELQGHVRNLNANVMRFKLIRERIRSEVGFRKARDCPCHVLTGKRNGNILCLAHKHSWENLYCGREYYFWVCSHCRMGIDYRATKAMMAKLTGEYTKHVVRKDDQGIIL